MIASIDLLSADFLERPVSTIRDQWFSICFSRFLVFPVTSSPCPLLIPLPHTGRFCPGTTGTWISSSAPTASVHLFNYHSLDEAILTIYFHGKTVEEHHVKKLYFSWPQVSCHPVYPPRGIRTVFMSYRDSDGEVQKFALRFPSFEEAEIFINTIKVILRVEDQSKHHTQEYNSEISSQSFLNSEAPTSRIGVEEESTAVAPVDDYSPELPSNLNCEENQDLQKVEKTLRHIHESNSLSSVPSLPPSFTSLVNSCRSVPKQGGLGLDEGTNLKSLIEKCMEDSSFQDMLSKVEKIVTEIGDGFVI